MNNTLKVWLDDVRPAPEGWVWLKTAGGCIKFLRKHLDNVVAVSLDHDLGDNVPTGYTVAVWLEEQVFVHNKKVPVVTIHSANPAGRKNIQAALDSIARYNTTVKVNEA